IATICHVETGNPFDVLCSGNNDDRKTRADACLAQTKTGNDCTDVATCNTAPFGEGCDATIYATALEDFCTKGNNIFDGQCMDGTHGEVTAARVSACSGAIAALPNDDASLCNKADLSGAICGDGDSVVGSNSFADICSSEIGNINYGVLQPAQEAFCRIGDIGRGECTDTIATFCGAAGSANEANLFDPLCTHDATHNDKRKEFCTTGNTIFDTRCNDTHGEVTTARKNECLRTGSSDFTGQTCDTIVLEVCRDNVFEQTTETPTNLCTGMNDESVTYDSLRLTACGGDITDLPNDDASLCNKADLSGAICGTGDLTGSDPFAPICSDGSATAVIDNFDKLEEQEEFCGDTRLETGTRVGDCATIYSGLCIGTKLFVDGVGAGGFDCSGDGAFDDARLNFCKIDATSFNANCNEEDYNGTDAARISLAETCRGTPADTGCGDFVNGVDGVTVADCTN
ncbi:MAG: hypothetical protein K8953_06860, partial [Proteobacteria bacterium]|nr:hypothetical protein [Pseudomonadota bacterium]